MRFLLARFSSLWRSLHMAAHSSGLVSSANLQRIHSASSSRSLMKMLNGIGLGMDFWGTLLITGLQLDLKPLITMLWASHSDSFQSTLCSSNSYFNSLSMRILWETVSNALLNPGRKYPLLSPHLPGHSFHHRRLLGWSSMVSWWSHADHSWHLSCPSWAWKWFSGLTAPSCSQGLRWDWLACTSLGPLACPSWR